MGDQVVNYQCLCCCAPLRFDGESGKLKCDYCDSEFEVAEVENLYREKEEKAAENQAKEESNQWSTECLSEDWGQEGTDMKSYICPSCAAELVCDETTAATCCPYCGNQTVVPGQFSGALKPEFVIPFKKDREYAMAALKKHYKGKKLLPDSFVDGNHIQEIQGVYVPFWMFDAVAEGEMSFHATTTHKEKKGDTEITTTKHYNVYRKGNMAFEKIPVDASSRMPDEHMDSIEPFDYSELKPFSTAYMPGFLADKYDVEKEECGKRMEVRCKDAIEKAMSDTVTGYESKTVKDKYLFVNKGEVHYAMLPVWMLSTRWNNENFLFAMNGQTGKMVGDLPMDKGKYFKYLGIYSIALLLLFAVLSVIGTFVLSIEMSFLAIAFFNLLLPLLIAFMILGGMKAKLKSVHTSNASHYADEKGLDLTDKLDQLVKTTVQTRKIQQKE